MKQKDFLATIPLNEEASKIREQELKLKAELQFQVELAKRPQPPPPPTAAAAVQLQPHHPLSPSSSNGSSAAGVGKQTPKQLDGSSSTAQPSQEEDAEQLQTCSTSENDQEDGPSPGKNRRRRSSSSSTSSVSNLRAVIGTVEEGLGKALIMLNGYMDYRPGINPLTRNIYDNFVPEFMAVSDPFFCETLHSHFATASSTICSFAGKLIRIITSLLVLLTVLIFCFLVFLSLLVSVLLLPSFTCCSKSGKFREAFLYQCQGRIIYIIY